MTQKCVQCGTQYEKQASLTQLDICPTCTDSVYQNMTFDMSHGGSWTGMTGVQGLSEENNMQ